MKILEFNKNILENCFSRSKRIYLYMVGNFFFVLNGCFIFKILIKFNMIGYKLGDFVYTRKKKIKIVKYKK